MKFLILPLLGILAACDIPNLDVDPAVVLGTGDTEFSLYEDGAVTDVEIIFGIQGGQHIWGAVRAIGVDWREVTLSFTLDDGVGAHVTTPSTTISRMEGCDQEVPGCAEGMGEVVGLTVVLDDPYAASDQTLTLTVTATDEAGRTAADEALIVPHLSL